ncbi:MAG: hypothetical protein ACRDOJ_13530 [Nocardioidaceae bacterium]
MTAPDARGPAPVTGLVAVAVLVAVALGGVALTQMRGGSTPPADDGHTAPSAQASSEPLARGASSEAERASEASRALLSIEDAVLGEREAAFDRVFADTRSSTSAGDDIFTSLRRLPLATYSLRYIGEVSHRGRTWRADVEVQWGLRAVDPRAATSEIEVTFRADGERTRVVAMSPADGEHAPVWLMGRLQVEKVRDALMLSLQPPLTDTIVAQTRKAVRDVRAVIGDWPGGLVVVLPKDTEQLEQVLAAKQGTYDSIAAVTTSADDVTGPRAPVRIVLNPPVFTGLGPIAGQVVLTHEATHAATDATFSDLPLWLVEGFADYVALAGEPVPVDVAAGQVLARVRRRGPPQTLPGSKAFATSSHGLGAAYEAAWLAAQLIAEERGEARLLRFYSTAQRTGDVDQAFASVLQTDSEQFTRDWRAYLRELAR